MKSKYITIIVCTVLGQSLFAQDANGITGEPNIESLKSAALFVNNKAQQYSIISASYLGDCVIAIQADAIQFWERIGTKGKRTLKFLNDLAAAGGSNVPSPVTNSLAKWSANPDGTVTVAP